MRKTEDIVVDFVHTYYHHLYHVVATQYKANEVVGVLNNLLPEIGGLLERKIKSKTLGTYAVKLIKDKKVLSNQGTLNYYMYWWFVFAYGIDMSTDLNRLKKELNSLN